MMKGGSSNYAVACLAYIALLSVATLFTSVIVVAGIFPGMQMLQWMNGLQSLVHLVIGSSGAVVLLISMSQIEKKKDAC